MSALFGSAQKRARPPRCTGWRRAALLVSLLLPAALAAPSSVSAAAASAPITFTIAPGSPIPAGGSARAVGKTDANGDGKPDLVVSNPEAGTVAVLLGNGHGGFSMASGSPFAAGGSLPSGLVSASAFWGSQSPPPFLPGADSNGGGIVVANAGSNSVSLLAGDRYGVFAQVSGSPFSSGGSGPVAVGGYGDPKSTTLLDGLAVANAGSGTLSARLAVVGNHPGFPAIAPGSPFATGLKTPSALAVSDFNNDGPQDVALVDSSRASPANVAVLLGNPAGGFAAAPGSPFASGGTRPVAVVAGDFNNDGKQDLAIANFDSNTISVLLGNGDGTFRQAPGSPFLAGGSGPSALATWDLNGDGQLDLAVTNQNSNTISVFAGDGSGRFKMQPGFPIPSGGSAPDAISVGDMNGDALGDLAVGNRTSQNVVVFLNTTRRTSFPALGHATIRRSGAIVLKLRAPTAGFFTVSATVGRPGPRQTVYGCGAAFFSGQRSVQVTVVPTKVGLRRFIAGTSLHIDVSAVFLRDDESATAGDIGRGARLPPRHRHQQGRVVVHVSRYESKPAASPQRSGGARTPSGLAHSPSGQPTASSASAPPGPPACQLPALPL